MTLTQWASYLNQKYDGIDMTAFKLHKFYKKVKIKFKLLKVPYSIKPGQVKFILTNTQDLDSNYYIQKGWVRGLCSLMRVRFQKILYLPNATPVNHSTALHQLLKRDL